MTSCYGFKTPKEETEKLHGLNKPLPPCIPRRGIEEWVESKGENAETSE